MPWLIRTRRKVSSTRSNERSGERALDVLYTVEEYLYTVEQTNGGRVLEIRGLTKRYGDRDVLRGVDLTTRPGQVVALLGPNGAGKTTLVSIVAGLRSADSGTVLVGDVDALADPIGARRLLGLAPQELGIYPSLTVRRNLTFFGELAGLRRKALTDRIDDVCATLALRELLPRRAGELSGGQKRRLHAAIAILHRPPLLFLDEPTVGADVRTRAELLRAVRGLADDGAAVVYTTHYLTEVEDLGADVAILEGGRVIERAPVEDLVARYGTAALRLTFDGPAPSLRRFTTDGSVATLVVSDPAAEAAVVLRDLGTHAAALRSVDVIRPSLEAAYLALTGRLADQDGGDRVVA
jgi:ABC-2 type transport system ATP-binding protein